MQRDYKKTTIKYFVIGICLSMLIIFSIGMVYSKGALIKDILVGSDTGNESNEHMESDQTSEIVKALEAIKSLGTESRAPEVGSKASETVSKAPEDESKASKPAEKSLKPSKVPEKATFPEWYDNLVGVYQAAHDYEALLFLSGTPTCVWLDISSGTTIKYILKITNEMWEGENHIHYEKETEHGKTTIDIKINGDVVSLLVKDNDSVIKEYEYPRDSSQNADEQFDNMDWMLSIEY